MEHRKLLSKMNSLKVITEIIDIDEESITQNLLSYLGLSESTFYCYPLVLNQTQFEEWGM